MNWITFLFPTLFLLGTFGIRYPPHFPGKLIEIYDAN